MGKGVSKAIDNVNHVIGPAIKVSPMLYLRSVQQSLQCKTNPLQRTDRCRARIPLTRQPLTKR